MIRGVLGNLEILTEWVLGFHLGSSSLLDLNKMMDPLLLESLVCLGLGDKW